MIEKKIELLPRSLKLRLCSSRLKKSLTSVKSIPLNIHYLEKMHIPWYDLYFHEFWNFFPELLPHIPLPLPNIFLYMKKKLKKYRSVTAHILYPCTTFCLTNQTKKNKKNTHWQMSDLGLGESLSASLSSFLFVVAKLFWALKRFAKFFF